MRRRTFIAGLGGAAVWPVVARAQQKPHRIAFVHSGIPAGQLTEAAGPFWVRRFYEGLRGLGDVEGVNLVVDRYSAEGRSDRFAAVAATVVAQAPDVIVVNLNDLVKAFAQATATIPIVAIMGDPIAAGLLTNLAHPGTNLTGVSINAGLEIPGKRLQILKEAMPSATKVGYLSSQTWPSFQELGKSLGITVIEKLLPQVDEAHLNRAFADMTEQKFDAAIIDEGGSYLARRALIAQMAEQHRLPIVYPYRDYVEAGGLMAYAPDLGELAQRMAGDVHQILNGATPGEIPFYQPTKFELIINVKTAKTLGLEISTTLLARADEVIE
jgi:putative tryptophan/tyrosine transport system substrate-binding protein